MNLSLTVESNFPSVSILIAKIACILQLLVRSSSWKALKTLFPSQNWKFTESFSDDEP